MLSCEGFAPGNLESTVEYKCILERAASGKS